MKRKFERLFAAALLLVGGMTAAVAQSFPDLSVRAIPQTIAPGQNVFVEVSATFPDGCTFGDGSISAVDNVAGDSRIELVYEAPDPGPCPEVLTFDRRVFGPVPFETANEEGQLRLEFQLQRGDGLEAFGETTISVSDSPPPVRLESGVWWSPLLPGQGFAVDNQGTAVFLVGFSYGEAGASRWRTFQGELLGGLVAGEWLLFEGGSCLFCGEDFAAAVESGLPVSAQLAVDGSAQAWLHLGDTLSEAIGLQRFHLQIAEQVASPDIPQTIPDLSGTWLAVERSGDPDMPALLPTGAFTFTRQDAPPSSALVSYAVEPIAGNDNLGGDLVCRAAEGIEFQSCTFNIDTGDVILDPPPRPEVPAELIGVDRILIPERTLFLRINDAELDSLRR